MTARVAINGYGRIGRNVLRALYEGGHADDMAIVAINDLGDVDTNAHLTRYDTAHGPFPGSVAVDGDALVINGDRIKVLAERDPAQLPWRQLGVDLVIEATGLFKTRDKAAAHLQAGAAKVLISAPAGDEVPTVVYGVNHDSLSGDDVIVSNASCTTNSLVPLIQPLHQAFGVEYGVMNTSHSYTNDQVLTDVYHKDLRRARSATHNMIPTTSGAAQAVGQVLPELAGKLDGFAIRVPTIDVSLVDLTLYTSRATGIDEVNAVLDQAASGPLAGVLAYTTEPLVSSDYMHNPASSTVHSLLTTVLGGRLVKVCAWYDNEWSFANRMLDTGAVLANAN